MILDETRLWQAVILRAIEDAIWVDPNPNGKRSERVSFNGAAIARLTATRLRDDAVFWLTMDKRDFVDVCEMAGIAPHQVRRAATRIINATPREKAYWNTHGFSLRDLQEPSEPRGRRFSQDGRRRLVLLDALQDDA